MTDGYRLNTLIDTAQVIGNVIVEKTKDVVEWWTEQQGKEEEAQPKEERG